MFGANISGAGSARAGGQINQRGNHDTWVQRPGSLDVEVSAG